MELVNYRNAVLVSYPYAGSEGFLSLKEGA
jgi:hypothetical protein